MASMRDMNSGLTLLLSLDPNLSHEVNVDGRDIYFIVYVNLGTDEEATEVDDDYKSVLNQLGWRDTNEDNDDKTRHRFTFYL